MFQIAAMHYRPRGAAPQLRDFAFELITGGTWTTPATVEIGDLIIANRISTGGGVQGMGADFTPLGDSSAGSITYDVNVGYRVATAGGATAHTVPTGGVGVIWSVWRAGTFNLATPVTGWDVAEVGNASISWADFALPATSVGIGGGWSNVNQAPGLIPGASLISESATTRYGREFFRVGGWGAQSVAHNPAGTAGQLMTRWRYEIRGA